MTITEANAVNEAAREVIKLAESGTAISPELEHGIGLLLINAHKPLSAGWSCRQFFHLVSTARARKAVRP